MSPDTRVPTTLAREPAVARLRHWFRRHGAQWRLPLLLLGPILVLLVAAYLYLTAGATVSTDDAYVQADKVTVSADVAGRVVAVEVHDNQPVHAGQVLFRLDDRQYRIAVEHAQAALAAARLRAREALANLAYRQREFDRQQRLFASRVTSQAALDEARNALDVARQQAAGLAPPSPADDAAAIDAEIERHPLVLEAKAALDQAELDLSHTVVTAPLDGIVTKVNDLPVGEYLNTATPAFALVATGHVWIEANFKETELTHVLPGDAATVSVDTYPGKTFRGHVQSIGPGTGLVFSVLPAQNATGNWVKVVQRVPVRVVIDNPDPARPLRAGMSAEVEIATGYSRLFGWTKPTPPQDAAK
ncbi:MAG: HlyD family secretion protein [Alphaproteobacteria bacterium]|nr:HlyD family secretion protein [Alphaproteobacteria bacterium]